MDLGSTESASIRLSLRIVAWLGGRAADDARGPRLQVCGPAGWSGGACPSTFLKMVSIAEAHGQIVALVEDTADRGEIGREGAGARPQRVYWKVLCCRYTGRCRLRATNGTRDGEVVVTEYTLHALPYHGVPNVDSTRHLVRNGDPLCGWRNALPTGQGVPGAWSSYWRRACEWSTAGSTRDAVSLYHSARTGRTGDRAQWPLVDGCCGSLPVNLKLPACSTLDTSLVLI